MSQWYETQTHTDTRRTHTCEIVDVFVCLSKLNSICSSVVYAQIVHGVDSIVSDLKPKSILIFKSRKFIIVT